MNNDILFETKEEKEATERVLAAFKVKSLNENIDGLVAEVLKYAVQIDDILEDHSLPKRYLDRVSTINENGRISLDDDLIKLDFRVKEILDDLINRINTRISIVKEETINLLGIQKEYDLEHIDLDHELEVSMLDEKYYL